MSQATMSFVQLVNEGRLSWFYKDFSTQVRWLVTATNDDGSVKSSIVLEGDVLGVLRSMELHYGVGLINPDENVVEQIQSLQEHNGNVETFIIFDLTHLFQVV